MFRKMGGGGGGEEDIHQEIFYFRQTKKHRICNMVFDSIYFLEDF